MEANVYVIEQDGIVNGQVEQRLSGHVDDRGQQRLKAVFEVVRRAVVIQDQDVVGRMTIESILDRDNFSMLSRVDSFAVGGMQGRIRYIRTPSGVRVVSEGEADGLEREPTEKNLSFDTEGPLIDHATFIYYIRSVPLEEGHTFLVATVNPSREGVDRMRGLVRPPRKLAWQGSEVEVWPIETSTPDGVTTYYIRDDAAHTLLRYASATGEVYELRPGEGP